MTSPAQMVGALQIAAALVFHLPGARLELSSRSGAHCAIGPMTDPRCTLHPAEFRELVVAAGNLQLLGTMLGFAVNDEPTLTLTSCRDDMDHLGGGLYRVAGRETTSYAFTTSLPARHVDVLMSSLNSGLSGGCADAAGDHDDGATMCVSLVQDDGLGVTLVVMSPFDVAETICVETAARAAASACLVAEMEQLTTQPDGFAA